MEAMGGTPPAFAHHSLLTGAKGEELSKRLGTLSLRDLRAHDVEMLTIGQYLAPSGHHLPVLRYVHPDIFALYAREAEAMGFTHAASAPLVRSSYHADQQAHGAGVT